MKTTIQLDYTAVLADTARPVHLTLQFVAPTLPTTARPVPVAFTLVIDRSGSMAGAPLEAAKRAAAGVIRNLRPGDRFALVAFDDTAEVIIPPDAGLSRTEMLARIALIRSEGSTNLTGGWMLGRDTLLSAPAGTQRRLLLLTDGELNVGIVDHAQVRQLVAHARENNGIRTSCLGFGPKYLEDLLNELADAGTGSFYDANQADQLSAIFAAELDGLQQLAVQNLRLRFKPTDLVERHAFLSSGSAYTLPDGTHEYQLGDLVSGEEQVTVLRLDLLPIPLIAGGRPAATWDGEQVAEVELRYDELAPEGITSHTERHTVRVRPTQNPDEVKAEATVIPWIATVTVARVLEELIALRDRGDQEGARRHLEASLALLRRLGREEDIAEAVQSLARTGIQVACSMEVDYHTISRKSARYHSKSLRRHRSHEHWTGDPTMTPLFKQPPPPPTPPPTDPDPKP